MAKLQTTTSVSRKLPVALSRARLREARVLAEGGCHAAAIYLGGYAVECMLKALICRRLDLGELPVTYHSHDLVALLLHSGLSRRMERARAVHENFGKLVGMWNLDDPERNIRYADPGSIAEQESRRFMQYLNDSKAGVLTWLVKQKT